MHLIKVAGNLRQLCPSSPRGAPACGKPPAFHLHTAREAVFYVYTQDLRRRHQLNYQAVTTIEIKISATHIFATFASMVSVTFTIIGQRPELQ
jgi:hypothetical protein